jgi:flagellar motor protein MotB
VAKVSLRGLRRRGVDFESLWLITFADLMVQLMAFFAVIYSFSLQGQQQMSQVVQSLQKALGVKVEGPGSAGILPGTTGIGTDRAADLEKLLADIQAKEGPDAGVHMRIVSFRGSILFDEGSSTVDAAFQPLMTRISTLVGEYPGFTLICEGHAAPGERSKAGGDALELSGQRAQAVVRFLAAQQLDMKTIAAEAHGDAQIEGDPSSPEGRALQRRVKFRFQRVSER